MAYLPVSAGPSSLSMALSGLLTLALYFGWKQRLLFWQAFQSPAARFDRRHTSRRRKIAFRPIVQDREAAAISSVAAFSQAQANPPTA